MTQNDLAVASGVSISLITKLESGYYSGTRMATVHKLAAALKVSTSSLMSERDAREAEPGGVIDWGPVRRALDGGHGGEPEEEPTIGDVRDGLSDAVEAVARNRYADLSVTVPALMRDADALVATSVDGAEVQARRARSEIRQVAAYMLGQARQFDAASNAIELAISDTGDSMTVAAAVDWKCWLLLRQGRIAESGELAARWADSSEPKKLSAASPDELAAWGMLLIRVSNAAVRDNRPDDAREALRLARAAAAAVGRDIIPSASPWMPFGPLTVAMINAENAIVQDRPDITLNIGAQIAVHDEMNSAVKLRLGRHRLDVAMANVSTRRYAEAVGVLRQVKASAPGWLAQQRYAQDILSAVIAHRRTLSDEMRGLAEHMNLPL